jgi:hypothetical protein
MTIEDTIAALERAHKAFMSHPTGTNESNLWRELVHVTALLAYVREQRELVRALEAVAEEVEGTAAHRWPGIAEALAALDALRARGGK